MTTEEYLDQVLYLGQRIRLKQRRVQELRELSTGISTPCYGVDAMKDPLNTASFTKILEHIVLLEQETAAQLQQLLALQEQIRESLRAMENDREAMVLECRYLYRLHWNEISRELYVSPRTVRRWRDQALAHFPMPAQPITVIDRFPSEDRETRPPA